MEGKNNTRCTAAQSGGVWREVFVFCFFFQLTVNCSWNPFSYSVMRNAYNKSDRQVASGFHFPQSSQDAESGRFYSLIQILTLEEKKTMSKIVFLNLFLVRKVSEAVFFHCVPLCGCMVYECTVYICVCVIERDDWVTILLSGCRSLLLNYASLVQRKNEE